MQQFALWSTDVCFLFQFLVVATDNRLSPRSAQASVIITVRRNEFPPVFAQPNQAIEISEYQIPLTVVSQITATDRDSPDVSKNFYYPLCVIYAYTVAAERLSCTDQVYGEGVSVKLPDTPAKLQTCDRSAEWLSERGDWKSSLSCGTQFSKCCCDTIGYQFARSKQWSYEQRCKLIYFLQMLKTAASVFRVVFVFLFIRKNTKLFFMCDYLVLYLLTEFKWSAAVLSGLRADSWACWKQPDWKRLFHCQSHQWGNIPCSRSQNHQGTKSCQGESSWSVCVTLRRIGIVNSHTLFFIFFILQFSGSLCWQYFRIYGHFIPSSNYNLLKKRETVLC